MEQSKNKTKHRLYTIFITSILFAALFTLTACGDGANSSSWRNSVNQTERNIDGGFVITVGSAASGQRNRTFELSADELASIHVDSTSEAGEIILIISQDGAEDGTEVRLDISNFTGDVSTDDLTSGRIRFSLRYEDIRNSDTTISWR